MGVAKAILRTINNILHQYDFQKRCRPQSASAIRYSALDPFCGWEENVVLHPKRAMLFRVHVPTTNISPELQKPQVLLTDTNTSKTTTTRENAISTGTVTDAEPSKAFCESESKTHSKETFRVGPLEKERRYSEIRSAYNVLKSQSFELTIEWLVKAFCECFALDCYNDLSLACSTAIATARETMCNESNSALISSHLKHKVLPLCDFKAAVLFLCRAHDPAEFDRFFRFISEMFGSDRVEAMRRRRVLQSLFSDCAPTGMMSTALFHDLQSQTEGFKRKRPSTAPPRNREATNVDVFCQTFVALLKDTSPAEFDQAMQKLRHLCDAGKAQAPSKRSMICDADVVRLLERTSVTKPVVVFLSASTNPCSLIEKVFGDCKDRSSCRLPTPPMRQKNLLCFGIESESSLARVLENISSGIERGHWIFLDCPKTIEPLILNQAMRKLALTIVMRPVSTINPSFRLFVRCGVDTNDIHTVPQIMQSVATVCPVYM